MIATVQAQQPRRDTHGRTQHQQPLPRTRQRLVEAQAALDRGEPTTATVLARVAIETASCEVLGQIDLKPFIRMIASFAGADSSKAKQRINNLLGKINAVAHGARDGQQHEAERMLTLIRVIGGRWIQRVFDGA